MPLKVPLTKKLVGKSDRVKDVDFHPTLPWVLCALFDGRVLIWDYKSRVLVKSIECTKGQPIRCAKFIPRKQWIVTGSDDQTIRVFNYDTTEKVFQKEKAHQDFIRAIAIHPTFPYVITASDDRSIVIWDWSNDFSVVSTFKDHTGMVMQLAINPKDPSQLASASEDGTVKVWGIPPPGSFHGTTHAYFTLTGHTTGVNAVNYVTAGERSYIVSGSDDGEVKVWDYLSKKCVQTLKGHSAPVFSLASHPSLPLIVSVSEDETLKLWHSLKFTLEGTHHLGLKRLWALQTPPPVGGAPPAALYACGGDEGVSVFQLGNEQPVVSLCEGQLVWSKGLDLAYANLRMVEPSTLQDGERIRLPSKDLGPCVLFPRTLSHHPQSRFFAVCDDREFYVYAARSLRYKCFGKASEFVWGHGGQFAVRDGTGEGGADPDTIVVYHDCEEKFAFKPSYKVEQMWGGAMLAVKSDKDFVCFYDWQEGRLVRRIDIAGLYSVVWSRDGTRVAFAGGEGIFTLSCDPQVVTAGLEQAQAAGVVAGQEDEDDEGIEDAFESLDVINELAATSMCWFSQDCLVYTCSGGYKLAASVGGSVDPIAHLDRPLSILGPFEQGGEASSAGGERIVLVDTKDITFITSYRVSHVLAQWQAAVVRRDKAQILALWPSVPADCHEKAARFLIRQGMKAQALKISSDPQLKFELATELGQIALAGQLIRDELLSLKQTSPTGEDIVPGAAVALAKRKWGMVGDLAVQQGALGLAAEAYEEGEDFSSWLMVASCVGDAAGLQRLADKARDAGDFSVSFAAANLLHDTQGAIAALLASDEPAEAALYARTYKPSAIDGIVKDNWKPRLEAANPLVAEATALPSAHPQLFPDYERTPHIEKALASRQARLGLGAASAYPTYSEERQVPELDLIKAIKTAASPPEFMKAVGADILTKYSGGSVGVRGTAAGQPAPATAAAPIKTSPPPATPAAPLGAAAAPARPASSATPLPESGGVSGGVKLNASQGLQQQHAAGGEGTPVVGKKLD